MTESKSEHDKILFRNSVLLMLEAIDTPRSLGLYIRLVGGLKPTDLQVLPIEYDCAEKYLKDAQALALISKNPWFFDTSKECFDAALEKFTAAESRCSITNSYFRYANFRHPCLNEFRPLLERARKIISNILGDFSFGQCDFGPGSSLSLNGKSANIVNKLRTKPECTPLAYYDVNTVILNQLPHYAVSCDLLVRDSRSLSYSGRPCDIVRGNRFSTVPKDWKSDRGICIEPLGNMLLQKGIGVAIRSRLKKFGHDLNVTPDLHGWYVYESSLSSCYATLDLASASDTISFSLVKSLLPFDWFDVLNKCRSHYTEMPDGTWIYNEKFSSMGNGFTFELESLIFLALGLAVKDLFGFKSNVVSVFGDDIVVSENLSSRLVALLSACGFTINTTKSFTSGPFYESCGYDFFNGSPVRPTYLKDIYGTQRLLTIYTLANRIRQVAHSISFNAFCDHRFLKVYKGVLKEVPRRFRLYGPAEYGDNVLLSPSCDWVKDYALGYLRIKAWRRVYKGIKPRKDDSHHTLTCALYGIPQRGTNSRVCAYTVKAAFVSPGIGDSTLYWC